jgi:hypothetical protein
MNIQVIFMFNNYQTILIHSIVYKYMEAVR